MKVEVEKLSKAFGAARALDNVSFSVDSGELLALLGPSGCGKTTCLRMVAGLESPSSGRISVDGTVFYDAASRVELAPHLRGVGMVFQSYALWPHRTVFQNVAFPLELRSVPREELRKQVRETLDLVALTPLEARYPHELSGGQQQRVALARALVMKPRVLLLDEPLSNLDAKLRGEMRRELRKLQRELKMTAIYVTHDKTEAIELSHRMAILDHGKLVQIGTPEEILRNPANEFVAEFLR